MCTKGDSLLEFLRCFFTTSFPWAFTTAEVNSSNTEAQMKNIIQTVKEKLSSVSEAGTFPNHAEVDQINRCLLILARSEHKQLSYMNALTLKKSVGFLFDKVGVIPNNGDHTKPCVGLINDSQVLVKAQQLSPAAQRMYTKIYEFANDLTHAKAINPALQKGMVDAQEMTTVGRLLESASVSSFKKEIGPNGNEIVRSGRFALDDSVSVFSRPSRVYVFDGEGGHSEIPVKASFCRDILKSISNNASAQILQNIQAKNNPMMMQR